MRWLVLAAAMTMAIAVVLVPRAARADDAVALLPLDADAKLEIYGQPVASEVARALIAGGINVVVVGPKMAVPAVARLVLDGKISSGKGDTVVLAVRIRNRATGAVIDTPTADAVPLTNIDRGAADLSARVLPAVRAWLAANPLPPPVDPTRPPPPPHPVAPAPRVDPPLVIAVGAPSASGAPLQAALAAATETWTHAHHRAPIVATSADLAAKIAPLTITTHAASAGLALEIVDYTVDTDGRVQLARARVRIRLSDATRVLFDRVIVTDTIVGDRDQPPAALAERVAREVLAIVTPNAVRELPELGTHAP